MAELAAFTDYEKEFTQVVNSLPARINSLLNYESNADNAQTELRRMKGEMSQAKQLVMDMEIAARGIAEPTRREMGNKIRIHKETLATLTKDLQQAEAKFDRNALMGGARSAAPQDFDKSTASRDRMAAQTEKLRGGTNQLNDAQRRLEETIDVGAGVMEELDRNRETLQRVRGNVRRERKGVGGLMYGCWQGRGGGKGGRNSPISAIAHTPALLLSLPLLMQQGGEVSGTLDTARRILRGMGRREIQNKIAVGVFAVVMIGIIALVSPACTCTAWQPGFLKVALPLSPTPFPILFSAAFQL
jgi:hypothetical protein